MKYLQRFLPVLGMALLAPTLALASTRASELPAAKVSATVVAEVERPLVERVIGSVAARRKPVVAAKVPGTIAWLGAEVGDTVTSGQLIARIDAREMQARLEQAIPQLDRARLDVARYEEMLSAKVISRQQYEEVRERVQTLTALVEEARTLLGYTRVVAPITGLVRARRVDVGDLANAGRPLFDLEGVADFRFEASVPESLTGRLRKGEQALVRIDAYDREFPARLAEITPAADPASRTFLARYDFETTAGLVSGQFGRLQLRVGTARELVIPREALVRRGQLELVFVIVDGRVNLRLVRAGRVENDTATILSGLSAGERIAARGAENLQDGQPVEIQQ